MTGETPLAAILRRDRSVALAALVLLTVLAWLYTVRTSLRHAGGDSAEHLAFLFVMWAVMMIAMMTPVAAPTVLVFSRLSRERRAGRDPLFPAGALAIGYLLVWVGYSLLGAVVQWGLARAAWAPDASPTSAWGGSLLVLAGLYQWTPVKHACLERCRSPLGMLLTSWRPGTSGALRMGAEHGAHCVACCWALMALMLLAGAMSPMWLALLAAYCLAERLLPAGPLLGRVAGAALIGWGLFVIVSAG